MSSYWCMVVFVFYHTLVSYPSKLSARKMLYESFINQFNHNSLRTLVSLKMIFFCLLFVFHVEVWPFQSIVPFSRGLAKFRPLLISDKLLSFSVNLRSRDTTKETFSRDKIGRDITTKTKSLGKLYDFVLSVTYVRREGSLKYFDISINEY